MNFNYIFVLVAALLGVFASAYELGYDGIYEGAGYLGAGYGPTAVSDTCQCVKTVVRPVVEQFPYVANRRVHSPGYVGGAYRGTGVGLIGSGIVGSRSRFYNNGYCGRVGSGMIL